MNFLLTIRVLLICAAVAMLPRAAFAQEAASDWVRHPEVSVRLVAATRDAGPGPSLRLGLEIALKKGWKTYWRSPGDAGLPVEIDWKDSTNLSSATLRYPVPQRFSLFDIETTGYSGNVILPIDAVLTEPGKAVALKAGVDLLVCEDVCIPYRADVALDLPAGPGAPSANAHDIAQFAARVPPVDADGKGAGGLAIEGADLRRGPASALVARVRADPPLAAPDILVEGPPGWSFARPVVRLAEGGRSATLTIAALGGPGAAPFAAGNNVTLTLVDGGRAVERTLAVGNAPPAAPPGTLLAMLAVALLGGLILNLMPCVLPVLAMKLAGLVRLDRAALGAVRRTFLATAAGVVVAFMVLASALVGLRLAGEAVGWGLQFQQPWFLSGMALVVVAFAANLWGWFVIHLPEALADAGAAKPLAGAFATGMFATLLATPCSAPFVGTAVGFALAQGPAEIYAIFAALGIGLAAPYLLVAAFPAAARLVPKPGAWMNVLRRVLGLALAGTASWLVWVLAAQIGWLAAGTLAIALAVLLGGLFALRRRGGTRLRVALALGVALLGLLLPPKLALEPARTAEASTIKWERFDRATIDAAVAEGKTVFVDVTADWCVTCQVNKRLVLSQDAIAQRLNATGTVALIADWTRPDARISAYLAEFGRYGIPFNAVYGPALPGGVALPELLTADAVLSALDAAGKR
ncbi:MAG: DUF255 domain-containing protein [Alphaproteobacteria bacterium]|nr:DUF255 domain-containing protein [Alphaproteobacteria bacterium]